MTIPAGLTLTEFLTPDEYCCDRCGRDVPEGMTMFGDRDAEYDLCEPCFAAVGPKVAPTRRAGGAKPREARPVDALRAELAGMRAGVLRRRAVAAGASEAELDEADDSEVPKTALIELLVRKAAPTAAGSMPEGTLGAPVESERMRKLRQLEEAERKGTITPQQQRVLDTVRKKAGQK